MKPHLLPLAILSLTLGSGAAAAQDAKTCALGREKPDLSIAACSKVITGGAPAARAAAFHNRGVAYAAKGDLQRAIADVSEGIRLDPKPAYRYQERGELNHRAGNLPQAIADLSQAIRLDPSRAFRFHSRANALKDSGELHRALADFNEAIRLDSTPRGFRFFSRGMVYRDLARDDDAIADFTTVIRLEPNNASALMERGMAYARKGDSMRASIDLDAAIAADPSNPDIRAARDSVASGGPPGLASPTPETLDGERTTFAICSRAGCTATLLSSGGINSAFAWGEGRVLESDAIDSCEGYQMPNWREDGGTVHRIAANCSTGTLTAPDGRQWRVTDAKRRQGSAADAWGTWELVGTPMDANERPPFEASASQFQTLCPTQTKQWRVE